MPPLQLSSLSPRHLMALFSLGGLSKPHEMRQLQFFPSPLVGEGRERGSSEALAFLAGIYAHNCLCRRAIYSGRHTGRPLQGGTCLLAFSSLFRCIFVAARSHGASSLTGAPSRMRCGSDNFFPRPLGEGRVRAILTASPGGMRCRRYNFPSPSGRGQGEGNLDGLSGRHEMPQLQLRRGRWLQLFVAAPSHGAFFSWHPLRAA